MRKLLHEELMQQRMQPEQAVQANRHPVILIIDSIRSAYNIGSLFRTADSALVQEVLLCGFSAYPPRPDISKTALGADTTVPWRYFRHIEEAIAELKEKGWSIMAVELTTESRPYTSLTKADFPLALILGNEITGIDNSVLAMTHGALEIPMHGVKHSLNVAVAAGIVTFEAVRAWNALH
jgi:tRNA G18 (ribose-2'-O)-methylase SpoU